MRQSRYRLRAALIVMVCALVFIAVMLACFGMHGAGRGGCGLEIHRPAWAFEHLRRAGAGGSPP
jgi:hypothetical protein